MSGEKGYFLGAGPGGMGKAVILLPLDSQTGVNCSLRMQLVSRNLSAFTLIPLGAERLMMNDCVHLFENISHLRLVESSSISTFEDLSSVELLLVGILDETSSLGKKLIKQVHWQRPPPQQLRPIEARSPY